MILVFLGFDGVLDIKGATADSFGFECVIDSEKMEWLNELCDLVPEIRVVLSTSWRERCYEMVVSALKKSGFTGILHEDWRTPHTGIVAREPHPDGGWKRGDEVSTWLSRHGFDAEKDRYVIFDDCNDFYPDQSLVLVDRSVGLNASDMLRAFHILRPTPEWYKEFLSVPFTAQNRITCHGKTDNSLIEAVYMLSTNLKEQTGTPEGCLMTINVWRRKTDEDSKLLYYAYKKYCNGTFEVIEESPVLSELGPAIDEGVRSDYLEREPRHLLEQTPGLARRG